MSDYHHLHPGSWKKRISTCQFAQPRANGHGRSISRFTVISNAAETEADTVQSYDPYRGSRMLQHSNSQVSHAKIIVHRDSLSGNGHHASRHRSGSNARRARANSAKAPPVSGRPQSSRGSVTSLRSSRQGTPHARGPSLRHKRGVDFTHIRKSSMSTGQVHRTAPQPKPVSEATYTHSDPQAAARSQSPELVKMPNGAYPKAVGARTVSKNASVLFNDELRHFSSNIAKDCDEAFRSSLIEDDSVTGSMTDADKSQRDTTPFSLSLDGMSNATLVSEGPKSPWDSRPLPPLPSEEMLRSPPGAASTPASARATEDEEGDEVTYRTAVPILLSKQVDRRVVSAPAYSQGMRKASTPSVLPAINENGAVNANYDKARIFSAPPHTPRKGNQRNGSMEYLSKAENTIRVVNSPTSSSPVKAPAPLNVRKKTVTKSVGRNLHGHLAYDGEMHREQAARSGNPRDAMKKKKPSWFKRSSKTESENEGDWQTQSASGAQGRQSRPASTSTSGVAKKKNFSFPFWKSNKNRDSIMSIAGRFTSLNRI